MKRYYKGGLPFTGGSIELDGRRIFNPTEEQMLAAGYELREQEPYVPSLDEVKARKLAEIDAYNVSPAVDNFKLNGMDAWLTVEERLNYDRSIRAYEQMGIDNAQFFINGMALEVPVEKAKMLLAQIQIYADNAYMATMRHKFAVMALDSIEDVENYDFTSGYPEQLELTI